MAEITTSVIFKILPVHHFLTYVLYPLKYV